MEKPHSTLAAKAGLVAGYGLSNSGNERNGFWYQGHGGGIDGFLSNYAYSPAINRGYFFAINASNGEAVREIDSTLRSFVTRDLQTPPQTPYLSGVNLSAMNGYFQPDAPRQEILRWLELITGTVAITSADDTLVITPMFGSRSLWRPLSEQLLRSKDGIRHQHRRRAAAAGTVGWNSEENPQLAGLDQAGADHTVAFSRFQLLVIRFSLAASSTAGRHRISAHFGPRLACMCEPDARQQFCFTAVGSERCCTAARHDDLVFNGILAAQLGIRVRQPGLDIQSDQPQN
jgi:hypothetical protein